MVEVIINGTSIDLISKRVKYTKQVNDLADLSTVNTSFTYSIRADKTPKNTQLFQQLGMVGDTSKFPYQKNTTQLIDNGAVLISKGISTVKETNDEYKLFIQDGIIEVFKLIENKTIGKDLDLSEIKHTKSEQVIIDSWNALLGFRYLIADYNGLVNIADGVVAGNYLIPSINVKYLIDKVFNYIGYTNSGLPNEISNHWITYPKSVSVTPDDTIRFIGESKKYILDQNNNWEFGTYSPTYIVPGEWGNITLQNGVTAGAPTGWTVSSDWYISINQPGRYVINMNVDGLMRWNDKFGFNLNDTSNYKIAVRIVGGDVKGEFKSNSTNTEVDLGFLNSGNVLNFYAIPLNEQELIEDGKPSDFLDIMQANGLKTQFSVNLKTTELNIYDFQEAFNSFSIKDFLKELMFRNALTPFVDNHKKHIEFVSLSERLDTSGSNVVDWSEKHIRRINERYVFDDYAQKNILRMKYENENDDYNDGSIYVENKNLKDEKRILESKFYSPERLPVAIKFDPNGNEDMFPKMKIWEKEIKEEDDGQGNIVQVIEYKSLTNKFFYVAGKLNTKDITIAIDTGAVSNKFYSAKLEDVLWPQIIQNKYAEIDRIFTDTRIHEIELALSEVDFVNIDMKKLYYFEQEMQYYILNKITWESGKPAKGEFIRVKRNG